MWSRDWGCRVKIRRRGVVVMTGADGDQELREIFYVEANMLLEEMRKDVLLLSEDQAAGSGVEDKSVVFQRLSRCAHTIKGSSGIVGFTSVQDISRALEMLFKAAKEDDTVIDAYALTLISESIEVCQSVLDGQDSGGLDDLLERLSNISNR